MCLTIIHGISGRTKHNHKSTHQGNPAVITLITPRRGGSGTEILSSNSCFGTSTWCPSWDLIAYRSMIFAHWLKTVVSGLFRLFIHQKTRSEETSDVHECFSR